MRIVALADTHLFHESLGAIPEGDLLVHAGDLLRRGSLDELRDAAVWLRRLPHARKIVVAGNHDWCFASNPEEAADLLGPGITYLRDSACEVEGLAFWGSPWQPEYGAWAFNLPRGAPLADRWRLIPSRTDVLVTHGPPRGIGDWSGIPGREGCCDLLESVRRIRPALHLFGHIHEDGGFWRVGETCYSNVTTWECERRPTVLDVDPRTRAVAEVSVPPRCHE